MHKVKLFTIITAIFLNISVASGWQDDTKLQLNGVPVHIESCKPVDIGNLPPEVDALQSGETDMLHAFVRDLNRDGVPDYLFVAHPNICGTGGCPYVLVDGKSRHAIGEFFGSIVLLDQKINGYPVIQATSKYDITSVTVTTHVFDGKDYKVVALFLLEERGIAKWKEIIAQPRKKRP
ncbi:MAG: hypothetical protein H7843_00155 [Nitrospirota bacterium]